ncbi:MAG: glycosyltransferase, partial [Pseudomonadota bacterium]
MNDPRDTDGSAQRPTVSVICRTIGRDTLRQALDSVGQQSWRPIELVLVDAADCHPLPDWQADGIELVRVAPGTALPRSAAANAGLDAATGDFILFLDDDDWILPDHIRQLVEHLSQQPRVGVVYS